MNELQILGLRGHGFGNSWDAVAYEVDGGGSGEVEIAFAGGVPEVNAFSADGGREGFAEGAPQNGGMRGLKNGRLGHTPIMRRRGGGVKRLASGFRLLASGV